MNQTKHTRRVPSAKLRSAFAELADQISNLQDRVTLVMNGNTFEIHLEDATINITINEKGGLK